MRSHIDSPSSVLKGRPFIWFVTIWAISTLLCGLVNPATMFLALGGAAFAALLTWLTIRLVRTPAAYESHPDDVLRPTGTSRQRLLQASVIAVTFLWILLHGWAYGSLFPKMRWMHLPYLSRFEWSLYFAHRPHQQMFSPAVAFMTLVVVPGTLMLLAGRTRRSLGITVPSSNIGVATVSCILIPLVFVLTNLFRGTSTITSLAFRLLHNFFNNGFTEEFFARGMLLSQLRGRFDDGWSLCFQALLFAAGHFGSTLAEPDSRSHVTLALANSVALNAPIGFALGVMALRGRSLAQGTIVHIFLDTMN